MIDLRQERYESVPEFIREPGVTSREKVKTSLVSTFKRGGTAHNTILGSTATTTGNPVYEDLEFNGLEAEFLHPKSAELETLWPGVGQDFLQASERGPSFYLTLGFIGGAMMSLAGLWFYAWLTHSYLSYTPNLVSAKKMVVTAGNSRAINQPSTRDSKPEHAEVTTLVPTGSGADLVVPTFSTYEVKTGDTLAVIAGKAYHRVSPRLLDAICKANGMRSADVLSLGQKLNLPEYRPNINQSLSTQ